MSIWKNPLNKAWRRLPQPLKAGLGVAGGIGATALTGGVAAGFLGSGALAGLAGGAMNMAVPLGLTALNYSAQSEAARWERDTYREQMAREDNAVQRRMADLKAAGLNPALAYQQGGASSSAGGHEYSAPQTEGLTALQYTLNRRAVEAQVNNLEMDVALKQLEAQKRSSELPFFTSDLSARYKDLREGRRLSVDIKGKQFEVAGYSVEQAKEDLRNTKQQIKINVKSYRNSAERHGLEMRAALLEYGVNVRDARIRSAIGIMKDVPPGLFGSATQLAGLITKAFNGRMIEIEPEIVFALKTLNDTGILKTNGEWNLRNLGRKTQMRGQYYLRKYGREFDGMSEQWNKGTKGGKL